MNTNRSVAITAAFMFAFPTVGLSNDIGFETVVGARDSGLLVTTQTPQPVFDVSDQIYYSGVASVIQTEVTGSLLASGAAFGAAIGVGVLAGVAAAALEASRDTVPINEAQSKVLGNPGFDLSQNVLDAIRGVLENELAQPFSKVYASSGVPSDTLLSRFKADGVLHIEPQLRVLPDFSQLKLMMVFSQSINRNGRLLVEDRQEVFVYSEVVPGSTLEQREQYLAKNDGEALRKQLIDLARRSAKLYISYRREPRKHDQNGMLEYVNDRFSISVPANLVQFDEGRVIYDNENKQIISNVANVVLWPRIERPAIAP